MISSAPIGWMNTGFPLAILVALAVLLPRVFVSNATRSHRAVSVAMALVSICLLVSGAVLFALIYTYQGSDVGDAIGLAPLATGLFFIRLSAMSALVWVPVLALVWFVRAQSVEARRGDDIARGST